MMGRKLSAWMLFGVLAVAGCGSDSNDGEGGATAGAAGQDGDPNDPWDSNDPGTASDNTLGGYQEPPSSYQTPPSSYQTPGSPPPSSEPGRCTLESSCTGCEDYCEACICALGQQNCNDVCNGLD